MRKLFTLKNNHKKARQGILTSLFCVLLISCSNEEHFEQVQYSGSTMGTQYNVSVVLVDGLTANNELPTQISAVLDELNQSMSTYISDSELSLLNDAPNNEWIGVPEDLFEVLLLSQAISETSAGAFDITVGPLVNIWGFGPSQTGEKIPTDSQLAVLLDASGYQKIRLNENMRAVQKTADIKLDLSAIAKGYAVDQVSAMLLELGYSNHMVEIGGEVKAQGHNSRGVAWRIGIENPSINQNGVQQAISVSGVGVATSGDYRNFFEVDGIRYSHTIDPSTGKPVTHNVASVTVIAASAAEADAYATAISVLGYEAGRLLAEQQNLAVFFILRENETFSSAMTNSFSTFL